MNEYICHFEHLPNELIIDLFKYFHADELFRIFNNLNNRFNNLIKSVNYLSLIISKENHDQIENFHIFSSYLYTLIIINYIDLNLCLFNKIRRLILINPSNKLLEQFDICTFHNLEYLSVNCIGPISGISSLYKKIFLNNFPNLKSDYNLGHEAIRRIEGWIQSPILRILKIGFVEFFIFKAILSICPNLYYLDFGIIIPSESSTKIEPHLNLKQLILRTSYNTWSVSVIKDVFACIPNLEKLSIHRKDNISIIRKSFIKYDWLSSIILSYFPLPHRFYCYFHIFHLGKTEIVIGPHLKNILNQIIENFENVHKNRYQTRLIID